MSWTDERIEELKQLWQAGLSASEIGKRLGVSKNAVVGKAHRLKLPARPSPIKRETAKRPASATSASASPASASASGAKVSGAKPVGKAAAAPAQTDAANPAASPKAEGKIAPGPAVEASGERKERPAAKSGARASRPRVTLNAPARPAVVATSCLWPIGDPGDADFHFCGEPAVPGKPYCAEHCARAYITRSRDQRSTEAA